MCRVALAFALLAHALAYRNFPLTNNALARGLLHRHYWHTQTLQHQLVLAEGKLSRSADKIEEGQAQMPNALVHTAERLQEMVNTMQRDTEGQASERQKLIGEVARERTKLNAALEEATRLKEELREEKVCHKANRTAGTRRWRECSAP